MALRLYVLQRVTAVLMVPLIIAHLTTIIFVTRHGLTAAEILNRTRGSLGWGLFYGLFVLCASVHGSIGVCSIAAEWSPLRGRALHGLMWGIGVLLFILGMRAVYAVIA